MVLLVKTWTIWSEFGPSWQDPPGTEQTPAKAPQEVPLTWSQTCEEPRRTVYIIWGTVAHYLSGRWTSAERGFTLGLSEISSTMRHEMFEKFRTYWVSVVYVPAQLHNHHMCIKHRLAAPELGLYMYFFLSSIQKCYYHCHSRTQRTIWWYLSCFSSPPCLTSPCPNLSSPVLFALHYLHYIT